MCGPPRLPYDRSFVECLNSSVVKEVRDNEIVDVKVEPGIHRETQKVC